MTTTEIIESLEAILTDEKITNDINNILWKDIDKDADSVEIYLDGEKPIFIPRGAKISVVTKALFSEHYEVGFGVYRIEVAIGGVLSQEHGILEAGYCFALLYYNENLQVITVDYSENFI